ncbi:hypothetical protein C0Q70_02359 [Pomacea canaliculata]|uniref:Uncharacterized protein n=1 Tax=Pomacea canaliculata TaxID=400727 RepID=A0A2T7PPU5_POMCA|nr:hypothetical protein C0Q70_02359 [Pomacea canaliculata]
MWDTVFVGSDTHTVCVEQCGWEEGERKQESCTRVEVGLQGRRGTYGVERGQRSCLSAIPAFNGFYQHNASSSKPIMEKRRRARINASLAELKSLLLEVIKKEGARHSKMEKADILEMAVKHLRQIQRQQYTSGGTDPTLSDKYRLGFNECAQEVSRYLGASEEDDAELRARLLNHLANCIASSDSPSPVSLTPSSPEPLHTFSHAQGNVSPALCPAGAPVIVKPTPSVPGHSVGQAALARFAVAMASAEGGEGNSSSAAVLIPTTEINNNIPTIADNNIVSSCTINSTTPQVTLTSTTQSQAIPSPSCWGSSSYIIPIYASPGLAASVSWATTTTPASSAVQVPFPVMAAPQVSAGAAVAGGAQASIVTLSPQQIVPAFPPVSVTQVLAAGVGGSLSWESSKPTYSPLCPGTAVSVSEASTSSSPFISLSKFRASPSPAPQPPPALPSSGDKGNELPHEDRESSALFRPAPVVQPRDEPLWRPW